MQSKIFYCECEMGSISKILVKYHHLNLNNNTVSDEQEPVTSIWHLNNLNSSHHINIISDVHFCVFVGRMQLLLLLTVKCNVALFLDLTLCLNLRMCKAIP